MLWQRQSTKAQVLTHCSLPCSLPSLTALTHCSLTSLTAHCPARCTHSLLTDLTALLTAHCPAHCLTHCPLPSRTALCPRSLLTALTHRLWQRQSTQAQVMWAVREVLWQRQSTKAQVLTRCSLPCPLPSLTAHCPHSLPLACSLPSPTAHCPHSLLTASGRGNLRKPRGAPSKRRKLLVPNQLAVHPAGAIAEAPAPDHAFCTGVPMPSGATRYMPLDQLTPGLMQELTDLHSLFTIRIQYELNFVSTRQSFL